MAEMGVVHVYITSFQIYRHHGGVAQRLRLDQVLQ
jgi:hypothetical protein